MVIPAVSLVSHVGRSVVLRVNIMELEVGPQESPYPWAKPISGKNIQMLSEKAPSEELDENNH